ncbi:hypothetical protein LPB41_21730 [Thalassospira sp. MA62]|nr:hypothetical protein [Thalassospira sp. MA62]
MCGRTLEADTGIWLTCGSAQSVIRIDDDDWVLLPQYIATVGRSEIGAKVGEFEDAFALTNALDMVFHGF